MVILWFCYFYGRLGMEGVKKAATGKLDEVL